MPAPINAGTVSNQLHACRANQPGPLSSPVCKNIALPNSPKSSLEPPPSRPKEGRLAIVTDAGRDAMDADVPLTNGTEADGEVVWS
jgi:hypothetical protein